MAWLLERVVTSTWAERRISSAGFFFFSRSTKNFLSLHYYLFKVKGFHSMHVVIFMKIHEVNMCHMTCHDIVFANLHRRKGCFKTSVV